MACNINPSSRKEYKEGNKSDSDNDGKFLKSQKSCTIGLKYSITKFLLDFQPKPLTEEETDESDNGNQTPCDSCKELFDPNKLLKHIAHQKACKAYYGKRFEVLKKEKKSERNRQQRKNMTLIDSEKINKARREKYANDPERKAERREIYQKEIKENKRK